MNFTYNDYLENAAKNQANRDNKIGYFKLDNGEEALARLNVSSIDSLKFATVHKSIFGQRYAGLAGFGGVYCLNPINSYENVCPLCAAAQNGHPVVDKAKQFVYVQLIVSYKDKATGQWSQPQPVIWERPAGFSRDIATILAEYGDLRHRLCKITRSGQKKETRYQILPVDKDSPVFKPEMIPEDFSCFNDFDLGRHSYWVKSVEEINTYFATGSFPEVAKNNAANSETSSATAGSPANTAEAMAALNTAYGAAFVPPVAANTNIAGTAGTVPNPAVAMPNPAAFNVNPNTNVGQTDQSARAPWEAAPAAQAPMPENYTAFNFNGTNPTNPVNNNTNAPASPFKF